MFFDQHCGAIVETASATPVFPFECCLQCQHCCVSYSTPKAPEKAADHGPSTWSLPTLWETQILYFISALGVASQLGNKQASGASVSKALSLELCLCYIFILNKITLVDLGLSNDQARYDTFGRLSEEFLLLLNILRTQGSS